LNIEKWKFVIFSRSKVVATREGASTLLLLWNMSGAVHACLSGGGEKKKKHSFP
jgi:hypothetical protein